MNRTRLYRWLRISVSAACLILCALLIALWVRSYWWFEPILLSYPNRMSMQITSWDGHIGVTPKKFRSKVIFEYYQPSYLANPIIVEDEFGHRADAKWIHILRYPKDGFSEIYIPHWMLVALSAALAAVPWIPWSTRFSLKTMLIVTAAIAAVLGLVVWMVR